MDFVTKTKHNVDFSFILRRLTKTGVLKIESRVAEPAGAGFFWTGAIAKLFLGLEAQSCPVNLLLEVLELLEYFKCKPGKEDN